MVIGCSLTFGTGLNYNQTWPYYVAKELGLDCINLGQPGTGINASYRAAKMWVPIIKPKAVMWYVPDPHRREIWPHPIIPGEEEYADSVKSIGGYAFAFENKFEFFTSTKFPTLTLLLNFVSGRIRANGPIWHSLPIVAPSMCEKLFIVLLFFIVTFVPIITFGSIMQPEAILVSKEKKQVSGATRVTPDSIKL